MNNSKISTLFIVSQPFKIFAITVLVLFVNQYVMSQQIQIEGFATNTTEENYNNSGVPLLQDFYFRFNSGDRHIQSIAVVPNDPSDKISLEYFDESHNDEFYYKITHRNLTMLSGVITDSKVFFLNGKESQVLNKPGENYELVLMGFKIYYHGDDHHIDEFGVFEEEIGGQQLLTIAFNDKNNDDLAVGIVYYAWLPSSYILDKGVTSQSNVKGASSQVIPQGIRLIKGFKLNFNNDDHHINEVGVLTTTSLDGNLNVFYSDRNRDDNFSYTVNWAILSNRINPFNLRYVQDLLMVAKPDSDDQGNRNDNVTSIDNMLHPDFVHFSSKNEKSSKKEWLGRLRKGETSYRFSDEGSKINYIGNIAVVTGEVEVLSKAQSKSKSNKSSYVMKLINQNNKWLISEIHFDPNENKESSHDHDKW